MVYNLQNGGTIRDLDGHVTFLGRHSSTGYTNGNEMLTISFWTREENAKAKEKQKGREDVAALCSLGAYLEVPQIMACFGNIFDHARPRRWFKEMTQVDHRHWRGVEVLRRELLWRDSPRRVRHVDGPLYRDQTPL